MLILILVHFPSSLLGLVDQLPGAGKLLLSTLKEFLQVICSASLGQGLTHSAGNHPGTRMTVLLTGVGRSVFSIHFLVYSATHLIPC